MIFVAFKTCLICGATVGVNAEKDETPVCSTHSKEEKERADLLYADKRTSS